MMTPHLLRHGRVRLYVCACGRACWCTCARTGVRTGVRACVRAYVRAFAQICAQAFVRASRRTYIRPFSKYDLIVRKKTKNILFGHAHDPFAYPRVFPYTRTRVRLCVRMHVRTRAYAARASARISLHTSVRRPCFPSARSPVQVLMHCMSMRIRSSQGIFICLSINMFTYLMFLATSSILSISLSIHLFWVWPVSWLHSVSGRLEPWRGKCRPGCADLRWRRTNQPINLSI